MLSPGSRAASEPESSAHRTPRARLSQTLCRGLHLVSSFKKTLTIRPAELGQKTESVLGSQVSSHPVGKRCCWGNLNGLCSCLSQGREAGPGRGFLPGEARDLKGPSGHSAKTSWNARAGDRDALPATSKSHGPPGCETCNIRG